MRYLWNIPYFVIAFMGLCLTPLLDVFFVVLFPETSGWGDSFRDWKSHYDSGEPWGLLDKGRQ